MLGAKNSLCLLSLHVWLETFVSSNAYFVFYSVSRAGFAATMVSRRELRTIQVVVYCGMKNCNSVMKAIQYFQTLYLTVGAEGTAKIIIRRVADCSRGCGAAGEL